MGVRQRRRTPIAWYRPGRTYFWAGMLLCLTVGLTAAGVYASWCAGLWVWLGFLLAAEVGLIVLYFWIVRSWLIWMDLLSDYSAVDSTVEWWHEQSRHHHHPGDH